MNKITQAVNPLFLYAPITRVDEEKREVTAYAFQTEVVGGEGGIRLKRSAMEAATPDYMEWANIRRMHQPDAVGVAESVVWDEKGALMVVRVEDDDAWSKVKSGVYKGLSVGVRPTLMRGKDVEKATWFETSLVDRPKDPGSRFITLRAEGATDGAEDCEVIEDEVFERGAFADYVTKCEGTRFRGFGIDALWSALYDVQSSNAANKEDLVREVFSEAADYLAPLVTRGELTSPDEQVTLTRLEEGEGVFLRSDIEAKDETISRLELQVSEKAEELGKVLTRAEEAEGLVKQLKAMPAPAPVARGGYAAIDKEALQRLQSAESQSLEEAHAELKRLETAPLDADDPEGKRRSIEISKAKARL